MRLVAIAVLASTTVLMGCLTSQDDKAAIEAADNEKCIGYGTTPGTPAYTDCRLKLDKLRALTAVDEASRPPKPFKNCPTSASGLACTGF